MKDKKVLVLGSAGMAGHIITLYLAECGYGTLQDFLYLKIQYIKV